MLLYPLQILFYLASRLLLYTGLTLTLILFLFGLPEVDSDKPTIPSTVGSSKPNWLVAVPSPLTGSPGIVSPSIITSLLPYSHLPYPKQTPKVPLATPSLTLRIPFV